MRTLVHSLNNFAFPNSLIYTIPNFVNLCIYSPVEHFPVLCRWSSRVIQMCINFFSKFFMYQAPVAWSKLPVLTKSSKTIKTFNYHVKRYFINHRWKPIVSFFLISLLVLLWHSAEYRSRGNDVYINIPLCLRASVCCDVVCCQGILAWYVRGLPGALLPGASRITQFAHSSWRDDM